VSKMKIVVSAGVAGLMTLAACGSGSETGDDTGAPSGGVRTVEVTALDTLRFEPASLSVATGETVRFVVTNDGEIDHEFVLGDEEIQMAHEAQAGQMDHMMADAIAALDLKPGETMEATVTFDQAGEILFGCHEPGHYDGGMVGMVTVG